MLVAFLMRANVDLSAYGLSPVVFGPAFLVLAAAAATFSFANWRCPACNGYLGRGLNAGRSFASLETSRYRGAPDHEATSAAS